MSEEPSPPGTDLLYHYTDQNGLVGIVERGELWATNLGCLNDLSEFVHGLNYLKRVRNDIIEDLLGGRPRDDPEAKSLKAVFEFLIDESERSYGQRDPAEYLYVFSLFDSSLCVTPSSVEADPGDNLQQWRAYSKGGFGYCIGFDKNLLEAKAKEFHKEMQRMFCGQCIYDDAEKHKRAKNITSALMPAYDMAVVISNPQTDAVRQSLGNSTEGMGHELEQSCVSREAAPSVGAEDIAQWSRPEAREVITSQWPHISDDF